jgi:hypothetical protein
MYLTIVAHLSNEITDRVAPFLVEVFRAIHLLGERAEKTVAIPPNIVHLSSDRCQSAHTYKTDRQHGEIMKEVERLISAMAESSKLKKIMDVPQSKAYY